VALLEKINLGMALRAAKKKEEALAVYEEVLNRDQSNLGPDHSITLSAVYNVSRQYAEEKRWSDAIPLLELIYQRIESLSKYEDSIDRLRLRRIAELVLGSTPENRSRTCGFHERTNSGGIGSSQDGT